MPSIGHDLSSIGHKIGTGAKKTKKAVTHPLHSTETAAAAALHAAAKGAHATHLDDAAKTANKKAIIPASSFLNKVRGQYISRPLVTVALEDSANPKDWFRRKRWQNHWREAEGISPWQIFTADIASTLPDKALPGNLSRLNDPNFDIKNPQDREVFKHGAAMLASGTGDAVMAWKTDPLVLAGGAVGKARKALVVKPIKPGTNVAKVANSNRVGKTIEHVMSLPAERRYAWAMRHPALKKNSEVADLLASAKTPEQARLTLKSAMDGSAENMRQLERTSSKLALEVKNIRDTRVKPLEAALEKPVSRFRLNPLHPQYKGSAQEAHDTAATKLEAEKQALIGAEEQHRLAELMVKSAGSIKQVPRGTGKTLGARAIVPAKDSGDDSFHRVTWWTYQPSKYNAPMRVLKSASTRRPGNVRIDEPGHPAEMTRRYLDRLGHSTGRGMAQADKDYWVGRVGRASNGTPAETVAALKEMESAAIHHLGKTMGLHPEAVQGVINRTFVSRDIAVEGVKNGEKGAFSGGKGPDGHWLDQVKDEDGHLVHAPMFDTDLENSHQLIDINKLTKVMHRHRWDMRGHQGEKFAQALRSWNGEQGRVGHVSDATVHALEGFNRFWKSSVLLRLGYTPRILADTDLRMISKLGAMTSIPLIASSTKQAITTGNTAMRVKGAATALSRHGHAKAATVMEPARLEGTERNDLVNQLQQLAKHEATVNTQVARIQDALSKPGVAPAQMSRHVAAMGKARAQQLDLANRRLELTGKRDALAEWTRQMNDDYLAHIDKATHPKNRVPGTPGRPGKFAEEFKFRAGGQVVKANDAGHGPWGQQFVDMSGFEDSARSLQGIDRSMLNRMRIKAGQPTTITPLPPLSDPVAHDLHVESYNRAWEKAVNDQIGKSTAGRLLLEGKPPAAVVQWMRKTTAGREFVRKTADSVTAHDLDGWVGRMAMHVDHYLPTPELKKLALAGPVKSDDLRNANLARGLTDKDLPVVHGDSLDMDFGHHANRNLLGGIVDSAFRKIATTPTNVLGNHPFFAGVYRREYKQQYKRLNLKKGEHVEQAITDQIERRARQTALRETKDTLYDLANASNLAHAVRFLMPFYAPFEDAMSVWGKLWLEDPARIGRTLEAFNAPKKAPDTYEYNGKTYMTLHMPKWATGGVPVEEGMPADVLKNIVFGDQFGNPGFGPLVTLPVAELVRDRPDVASAVKPVLPFGPGKSWTDQVLPAWAQRALSLTKKEEDETYAKSLVQMIHQVDVENNVQHKGWTEDQMIAEARRRADALYSLRWKNNLLLPFSPDLKSPDRLYTDAYRKMQEKYSKDPHAFPLKDKEGNLILDEEGKPRYLTAEEKFVKHYGSDYFAYTQSLTKQNTSFIPITDKGFHGFKHYRDLIEANPELASLIVGDDPDGTYSQAVYEWMIHTKINTSEGRVPLRRVRTPKEALEDIQVQKGWAAYNRFTNAVSAALVDMPDASADDERRLKDAAERTVRGKYPAWGKVMDSSLDFGKMDRRALALEKIVSDPRMKGRPGFASLADYLAYRRDLVTELQRRRRIGGSGSLGAKENADLDLAFLQKVTDLTQADTKFEDIYNRWLQNDRLVNAGEATAQPTTDTVRGAIEKAKPRPTAAELAEAEDLKRRSHAPVDDSQLTPEQRANVDRSSEWLKPTGRGASKTNASAPGRQPAEPTAAGAPTPPSKPSTPAAPKAPTSSAPAAKGNLQSAPVSHNADGSVSKLQTTTFTENGQTVVIPYAGPDGHRLSKAEAIAQYKRTGKHLGKYSTPEAAHAATGRAQ